MWLSNDYLILSWRIERERERLERVTLFSAWEKRVWYFYGRWQFCQNISMSFWPLLSFLQERVKKNKKQAFCSVSLTPCFHPKATAKCSKQLSPAFLYWTQIQWHIHWGTNISIITSCLTTATVIRSFHLEKNHMTLLFDRPWGTRVRLTVCCHLSDAQNGMQLNSQMARV